jgi:uncharacterized protein (TIGR02246 family)
VHADAALYAKNAGYVSRAGMLLTGRAEIEELHAKAFAGSLRDTKLALKARRIAFLTSAVALVHADVELKYAGNDRNPEPSQRCSCQGRRRLARLRRHGFTNLERI